MRKKILELDICTRIVWNNVPRGKHSLMGALEPKIATRSRSYLEVGIR
jgi:hypothetical protein